jgi:hypothetical protein
MSNLALIETKGLQRAPPFPLSDYFLSVHSSLSLDFFLSSSPFPFPLYTFSPLVTFPLSQKLFPLQIKATFIIMAQILNRKFPNCCVYLIFWDGILGHQFYIRLESFAPCYSQSRLLVDFKENHTLLFKNTYEKIRETGKLKSNSRISFCKKEKWG